MILPNYDYDIVKDTQMALFVISYYLIVTVDTAINNIKWNLSNGFILPVIIAFLLSTLYVFYLGLIAILYT